MTDEKELQACVDSMMTEAFVTLSVAIDSLYPLSKLEIRKVITAALDAIIMASKEEGLVLRVVCRHGSEVRVASDAIARVFDSYFFKGSNERYVTLLHDKSTSTRFELSNNSAVMIVMGKV